MTGLYQIKQLTDGNAVVINMKRAPLPCTIWVKPVAGDTVNIYYSLDDGLTYSAWDNGAVTSASTFDQKYAILLSGVSHIKGQRTAGSGTTSTFGIC